MEVFMKFMAFVLTMIFAATSFAGGKFIFKPYKNENAEVHSLLMGLAVDKKLAGPISWVNFTGLNQKPLHDGTVEHKLIDVYFNNAIKFKPMNAVSLEGGLELHKDVDAKAEISETYYMKLAVDLW
jgi:hypothetical protein